MIPEEELLKLRRIVARLCGEDIAQDTMVRVLRLGPRENWFKREIFIAKRYAGWMRAKESSNESQEKGFDEDLYPPDDDTNRIIAYIELRERAEANPYFRHLLRVELGFANPISARVTLNRYRRKARDETHRKFAPRLVSPGGTCKGGN